MAKRKKLNKAAARAKSEYAAFVISLENKYPAFAREKHKPAPDTLVLHLGAPPGRETKRYPSKVTPGAVTNVSAKQQYTGTKVLGISTMHKSNMVPVFSSEEAQDISKMRRN